MKGKIDKYGTLYIERAGKMKDQLCPYASECGSPIPCSDTCPLFGEPRPETGTASAILDLCQGKKLFFDKFTDEREA
jgi:hypothetical protein